jgi:hypothetical protein
MIHDLLEFGQARAAIRSGAQRGAKIGNARRSLLKRCPNEVEANPEASAHQWSGRREVVGRPTREHRASLHIVQDIGFKQDLHRVPLQLRIRRPEKQATVEPAPIEDCHPIDAARFIGIFRKLHCAE